MTSEALGNGILLFDVTSSRNHSEQQHKTYRQKLESLGYIMVADSARILCIAL